MDNKGLLTIVVVVLIGIFAVLVIQMNQKPKTVGDQISEIGEEIGDEIDDHTTER